MTDYDVVLDTLQKHRDTLWKITKSNMESEFIGMGIMDDIRLEQIEQLDSAIALWKVRDDIREVLRISDRKHDSWDKVKAALK